jgi:hypothetical protein
MVRCMKLNGKVVTLQQAYEALIEDYNSFTLLEASLSELEDLCLYVCEHYRTPLTLIIFHRLRGRS